MKIVRSRFEVVILGIFKPVILTASKIEVFLSLL